MTNEPVYGGVGQSAITVPQSVDRARWLWIGSAVVGFVRTLFQLSNRVGLVAELRKMAPQLNQEQVDSATNGGILFTIICSLAVLAVYVAIATQMARGRQWARVVMTVFGVLSVLGTAFTLFALVMLGSAGLTQAAGGGTTIGPVDIVFSVVVVGLEIATLVFLFYPESNRFFRDNARRRRTGAPPV